MKSMLRNWRVAVIAIMLTGLFAGSNTFAADWWETIKVKGDFRYRHEMIDKETKDVHHRQRIRARLGIYGTVSPYTKVGIQLATGSDDPVSTNQTLDGAFSTKQVGVDLAYFDASHPGLPGFKLVAGKLKNPFFMPGKSELIWDSDWNPEGGAVTYTKESDGFDLILTGAGFWIDERSSGDDSFLGAGQAVGRIKFNDKKLSLAFGGSFFNYVNAQGYEPFFDHEDAMGNSTVEIVIDEDTVGVYSQGYELVELFGEVNHKFESTPVTVMFDYVTNGAADSLNSGWLAGLRLGKAKKPGSWQVRYLYRNLETDAVLGMFSDSDFRGGGTDAKGHEFGGAVQLADNTTFIASYFINEIGLEADATTEFNRLQIDLQLKF